MIYQTILASAFASVALATSFSSASPESMKLMFDAFKKNHGVAYKSQAEEEYKFGVFVQNLKNIDMRNEAERKAGGSAQHGVTRFADMTPEEFKGKYLSYTPDNTRNITYASVPVYTGAADLVDWAGVYTTPVKDQAYCGSCWAFAASEQIESDAMRELGVTYTLSPEQLVECDKTSFGCNGGLQERAYSYVSRAGGIEQDSDYPYTSGDGSSGSCTADKSKFVLTVSGYKNVNGEADMTSYVKSTGPLSIAIDANTWSSYTGGIMTVCGDDIDHAVQLVGVDTSAGYWKVRNSWGEGWGESGYIRLAYGQDTCGITYDVTYTTGVKKV